MAVFLNSPRNAGVTEQPFQVIPQDQLILPVEKGPQLHFLAVGTDMNGRGLPWMGRLTNDQLAPEAVIMVRDQWFIEALLNSDLMLLKGDQLFSLALPGTVIDACRQGDNLQQGEGQDGFGTDKIKADGNNQ